MTRLDRPSDSGFENCAFGVDIMASLLAVLFRFGTYFVDYEIM